MAVKSQHLLICGAVMLPLALGGCIVPADRYYYEDRYHHEYDHWEGAPHDGAYHEAPPAYYYREHDYEYDR